MAECEQKFGKVWKHFENKEALVIVISMVNFIV